MTISHWPKAERPREKLLTRGSKTLSDAELLAIFLRTGCAGKSAVDLARELLAQFGSLRAILEAEKVDFCQARGLGEAKYAQLQAILEMTRRHLGESLGQGSVLDNPSMLHQYLLSELRHQEREVFGVLLLDNQQQMISYTPLFYGTINAANVYPREVVKLALSQNASAMVVAHNHPSGVTQPSMADKQITKTLSQALKLVDITLLDHLIIGNGEIFSFSEKGWI